MWRKHVICIKAPSFKHETHTGSKTAHKTSEEGTMKMRVNGDNRTERARLWTEVKKKKRITRSDGKISIELLGKILCEPI